MDHEYVRRAEHRLRALDVLYEEESWADVVRESQEVVELALNGLLRSCGIEPPRTHDVAEVGDRYYDEEIMALDLRTPALSPSRTPPPGPPPSTGG